MPIRIDNETHWRSSDIKRLVKGAYEAGGISVDDQEIHVRVRFRNDVSLAWNGATQLRISLTKRGTSQPHPIPMVALATAGAAGDSTVYPFQSVFWLANYLAWRVSSSPQGNGTVLPAQRNSVLPPAWGQDLYIAKYADPLKDAAYVAFAEKKQKEIAAAQARVDKWTAERQRVNKNLARATKELRAAQKSLRDAKKRRGG